MIDKRMKRNEFNIEIKREELEVRQANNQLGKWRRMFECLSKHPQTKKGLRVDNKKSYAAFTKTTNRKSVGDYKEIEFNRRSINKRVIKFH